MVVLLTQLIHHPKLVSFKKLGSGSLTTYRSLRHPGGAYPVD
jgi:hypothetical protein